MNSPIELYLKKKQQQGRLDRILYFTCAFIILIAIILLWRGCETGKNSKDAYAAIRDSLRREQEIRPAIEDAAKKLKYSLDTTRMILADIIDERDRFQDALLQSGDNAERLAAQVKKAKVRRDTLWYVKSCDSLVQEAEGWKQMAADCGDFSRKIDSLNNVQNNKSDSLINHWKQAYQSCMKTIDYAAGELTQIKPRNKIYIEGAAGYSPMGITYGGGLNMVTKKSLSYGVQVMQLNGQAIYMGRIGLKLSLR